MKTMGKTILIGVVCSWLYGIAHAENAPQFVSTAGVGSYRAWDCIFTDGSLWVLRRDDNNSPLISRYSPNLDLLSSFGGPRFAFSIAGGQDYLWVADIYGNLWRYSYDGQLLEQIGWSPGWGVEADESHPRAIRSGIQGRLLYTCAAELREYDPNGNVMRTFPHRSGESFGGADTLPGGGVAALTNWGQFGEVQLFNFGAERIITYSRQGGGHDIAGFNAQGNWLDWMRIATDKFGNIYVCQDYFTGDNTAGNIYKLSAEGNLIWTLPVRTQQQGAGQPFGVEIGSDLSVYVLFWKWSDPRDYYIGKWRQEQYQARLTGTVTTIPGGDPVDFSSKVILRRQGSSWEYPVERESGAFGPIDVYPGPAIDTLYVVSLDENQPGTSDTVRIVNLRNGDDQAVSIHWRENDDVAGETQSAPNQFEIASVCPNPFNSTTQISYILPNPCSITLQVIDLQGRLVAELARGEMASGLYTAIWHAGIAPAGVYLCRLRTENNSRLVRLLLLK